jgi:E3 ubiquitin-protein ligase UBR4
MIKVIYPTHTETANIAQFYNLAPAEYNSQDAPKIDGLACSFLLSNPELLDYNRFYDACIQLLDAGSKYDVNKGNKEQAHFVS